MDNIITLIGNISWWMWLIIFLLFVAIRDVFFNKTHTILHNFPILGHFRYFLESIGPELRQYFFTNDREELPFNRVERSWIYASSKKENNYESFGTDMDLYEHSYIFINQAMLPYKLPENHINKRDKSLIPSAKVIGEFNKRKRPFRPSAEEVETEGFYLGEMDAKLLQKIEELTLYTINQEKSIEKLKKENDLLKSLLERVSKLEEKLEEK